MWKEIVYQEILNLRKDIFELEDLYVKEKKFKLIYPKNNHIHEKIRQQLQILRDDNLVVFLGNGKYKVK